MTLNEAVLQRLAEWHPPAGERHSLQINDEASGWSVTLTADRNDEVACRLWEIALRRDEPLPLELAAFAGQIAERTTGLLEPLRVVEVDVQRGEAILRTAEPRKQQDAVRYYEIVVMGTSALALRRFRGFVDEPKKREQLAFALTHEAVAAVISNLSGS
jgi:hypothetical protein